MTDNEFMVDLLKPFGINDKGDLLSSLERTVEYLKANGFKTDCPKLLYRYRNAKHAIDEIEGKHIYLSPLKQLSDPYDCLIPFKDIWQKSGMAYAFDENDIDDEDRDFFEECQDDIFDDVKNMLKICCFSEDYRSFPCGIIMQMVIGGCA